MRHNTAWSASTTPAAHPTNAPPTSPVPAGSDGPLPSRNTRSTSSNTTGSHPPTAPTATSPFRGPPADTSDFQNTLAASRPAASSWRSRKFSNHSKTSRNPARSRSVKPRNSARSFLQHQRVLMRSWPPKKEIRATSTQKCSGEHLFQLSAFQVFNVYPLISGKACSPGKASPSRRIYAPVPEKNLVNQRVPANLVERIASDITSGDATNKSCSAKI